MTQVLVTVDTELSARLHRDGASADANFAASILGRTPDGDVGIGWQMDRLERRGLRGVFFIDPFPALVLGERVVADIVEMVASRGHDVQLHAHTEWLEWAPDSPVGDRRGRNIGDFALADQVALLGYGCEVLTRAGAPRPVAFRAGNFGANDDTLRALATLGLRWDSSLNPDYLGSGCGVTIPAERNLPVRRGAVIELPVSGLMDAPGHFRPAQICAISGAEMDAAMTHAADRDHPVFTIVTHSFEMMSRDRRRRNGAVMRRFETMAGAIAIDPRLDTAVFADLDDRVVRDEDGDRLVSTRRRTFARMAAQALATWRYERQLRPV